MLIIILRLAVMVFGGVVAFLIVFALVSVAPVDRTPAHDLPSYAEMKDRLSALDVDMAEPKRGFGVGFGKVNITPSRPVATAGYGKRRGTPYVSVHDSIFVRAMVITNGASKAAVVSADLLIIPPTVTRILEDRLAEAGFSLENTYLGATHSHNSIGQWGEGATRFIYGAYEDSVVTIIADGIIESIRQAEADVLAASLRSGAIAIPQAVENRLIDGGTEDPYLRVLEIHREDSSKSVLMTYAAHATCISQKTVELSRDYPGLVVDELEEKGYSFAMFMAGAVGSHRGSAPSADWNCMRWMSDRLVEGLLANRKQLSEVADSVIVMEKVALSLSSPQARISADWKIRPWLFHAAFGEYESYLTVLRIGDVVMMGTPCDFSGELNLMLEPAADSLGLQPIVTSFNGGYIGYVTPGEYYDIDHYETRLMNWYAPGTGDYLLECLKSLMTAVSDAS